MTLQLPHQWLEDEKLRQNFEKIAVEWPQPQSNWTSYTATVASTSVTLGTGGTNVARYQKSGRTVSAYGKITLGTAGVFTGTDVEIALPFAAAAFTDQVGQAYGLETGVYRHDGLVVVAASASTFKTRFAPNGTDNSLVALGASTPFTWGDTDALYWQITYEAAS